MSDGNDVERHYQELQKQLLEDGFAPDSEVMKTTDRLAKALKEDGFSLTMPTTAKNPAAVEAAKPVVAKPLPPAAKATPTRPVAPEPEEETQAIVRAFRAKDQFDTDVITSVFASIDGWRTKVIEHNGSHFVIATNAKRLTDNRVKKALVAYVAERRQHGTP